MTALAKAVEKASAAVATSSTDTPPLYCGFRHNIWRIYTIQFHGLFVETDTCSDSYSFYTVKETEKDTTALNMEGSAQIQYIADLLNVADL